MNWNIINILMLFGAVQGFLLSAVVVAIGRNKNPKAACFLAVVLFGLSMNLLFYFAKDVGLMGLYPTLNVFYFPWPMLMAICFYFYVVFSAPFQKKLTPLNVLGFLPFILFSIVHVCTRYCRYLHVETCQIKEDWFSFFNLFEEYSGILFGLFMGFLSYKKINAIEIKIQNTYSNYNESKLKFHKDFLKLALIFILSWATLFTISTVFLAHKTSLSIFYFLWLFLVVLLHWVAWTGFIKDEALLPSFNPKTNVSETTLTPENDDRQKVKIIDALNPHYVNLISLFEREQIFKNSDLSLDSLSEQLGISRSYLSTIINTVTQSNFYHFVNKYRVDYLISLFEKGEHEHYTILSLAYEVGFNSKSTFQSSFKKITNHTPTSYIKSLQNK